MGHFCHKKEVKRVKMSIIWFLLLSNAYVNGIKITEVPILMISIFYIGDCILMRKGT